MENRDLAYSINLYVGKLNLVLEKFLFFKIYGFPFLVLLAICVFIFCNVTFNFVSLRMFKHSIDVIRGKYTSMSDPGKVTHSEAIYTAALSTVGLGSVAGVAIAISVGGPGAVLWILVAGLLGMAAKFAEISLGHKYRVFTEGGMINGGPFLYMRLGMAEAGWGKLGAFLGAFYAAAMIGASFGAPNMFQTNQTALVLRQDFTILAQHPSVIAVLVLAPIVVVVLANAKGIAKLAGAVVPFMTIFYIFSSLIVLAVNYKNILPSLALIAKDAFTPQAATAGIAGAMVAGFSRAVFATEAGGGTAAIAHAPSKTREHIREGVTGFIEVLLAITVCIVTGLVIVITGVHQSDPSCAGGVLMTRAAFKTVHPYFSAVLAIAVYFLAVTTTMGWSYFGIMAWTHLFKGRALFVYKIAFLFCAWYGAAAGEAKEVITFCDYMWSILMVPNLLVLAFLSPMIKRDLNGYIKRLKAGEFVKNVD